MKNTFHQKIGSINKNLFYVKEKITAPETDLEIFAPQRFMNYFLLDRTTRKQLKLNDQIFPCPSAKAGNPSLLTAEQRISASSEMADFLFLFQCHGDCLANNRTSADFHTHLHNIRY